MRDKLFNSRRFFRMDVDVGLFISAHEAIYPRDIYALDTNYFPESVLHRAEHETTRLRYWLRRIQEHQHVIEMIFEELIEGMRFFQLTLELVSKGHDPKLDPQIWFQFDRWKKGFHHLRILEGRAPKTHQLLCQLEDKFVYFMRQLDEMVSRSTPDYLHANPNLQARFPIDERMEQFSQPRFAKIPMIQALLAAGRLLNTYARVFIAFNNDHALRNLPERWPIFHANLSGSGVAVVLEKSFRLNQKVDVGVYFPQSRRACYFLGSIVAIRPQENDGPDQIAINFDLPDGREQAVLITELQRLEIQACFSLQPLVPKPWILQGGGVPYARIGAQY